MLEYEFRFISFSIRRSDRCPVLRRMFKSKIHRATVTDANLDYEGSISLDPLLMEAADILPHEQVHVWNVTRGSRLTTYAIVAKRGSGEVCVNGPRSAPGECGGRDHRGDLRRPQRRGITSSPAKNRVGRRKESPPRLSLVRFDSRPSAPSNCGDPDDGVARPARQMPGPQHGISCRCQGRLSGNCL